jgi:hypothetical protein
MPEENFKNRKLCRVPNDICEKSKEQIHAKCELRNEARFKE